MVELKTVAATCPCMNLRKAARVITQQYDEALQPSGLLVSQFTILVALAIADAITMTDLARELVMDRTTLTRNLKPLERQDFIQIKPGQDQRTRMIHLTSAGLKALEKALPLWEQVQHDMVEGLGQEHLNRLLTELSSTVKFVWRS